MINKENIAKALLNEAKQVASDNSYVLIREGENHESDPNETYIEEMVVYGGDNSIGLSDASSDIQFGFYQINVNTPQAEASGKWDGLTIIGVFQTAFRKGLELEDGGQTIRIKNVTLATMMQSKTHYIHILSIDYSVIN